MPGRDGTGPLGQGPVEGRGQRGQRGVGAGPSGYCICPHCGQKVIHTPGVPCTSVICPNCGSPMIRGL